MLTAHIERSSPVIKTARVMQVEGLFDVPPSQKTQTSWDVAIDLPKEWNVGVIVGPSGAGKTTVARELFGDNIVQGWPWDGSKSILDGFPASMSIKEVTELLSSVGFSSPPQWLCPFHVLSNGEQFRVNMARTLAEMKGLAVVDEFTSVIDRQVARIGSSAIQKCVRRRGQKLIAVGCHYDVLDWLEPDWVYQPHINKFYAGRSVHRRPAINLEIRRVHRDAWQIFRRYHYLDAALHPASQCFVAFIEGAPAAFVAILHFPHAVSKNIKRGHRTVCLPDFQGVGVGSALADAMGSMCRGLGYRYRTQTSHPGLVASRKRSKLWRMDRPPELSVKGGSGAIYAKQDFGRRLVASFEYIGPAMDAVQARRLWSG